MGTWSHLVCCQLPVQPSWFPFIHLLFIFQISLVLYVPVDFVSLFIILIGLLQEVEVNGYF